MEENEVSVKRPKIAWNTPENTEKAQDTANPGKTTARLWMECARK